MSRYNFSFPTEEPALRAFDDIIRSVLEAVPLDATERHRLLVIASEMFNNAYLHGNQSDARKRIEISLDIQDGEFRITARDQGEGIKRGMLADTIEAHPNPDTDHGRGLKILRNLGDKLDMATDADGWFRVSVVRKLKNVVRPADLMPNG